MKKLLGVLFAFASITAAYAQSAGTVTNHAFAIGKGAGVTGYTSLLCASGQIAIGGSGTDPVCRTITGDGAISAAGVLTLPTVNANVGSFGSTTQCVTITANAKGLITAVSAATCVPAATGTPTANQMAQWTNATTIQGVNIASVLTAGSGIAITGTTNATISTTAGTGQVLQASAGTLSTSSTTDVMGGAGGTCKITPASGTRVHVVFEGAAQNNTANDAVSFQLRFGTGTAPTAGAAVTGTAVGSVHSAGGGVSNANVSFPASISGVITGLTPGTAYWFDLALHAIVGGTASVFGLDCEGFEF